MTVKGKKEKRQPAVKPIKLNGYIDLPEGVKINWPFRIPEDHIRQLKENAEKIKAKVNQVLDENVDFVREKFKTKPEADKFRRFLYSKYNKDNPNFDFVALPHDKIIDDYFEYANSLKDRNDTKVEKYFPNDGLDDIQREILKKSKEGKKPKQIAIEVYRGEPNTSLDTKIQRVKRFLKKVAGKTYAIENK